jgi:hypothetical protein
MLSPGGPQSFGAYIIYQATGFLRCAAKFEAYLRFQATGFCGYVAKLEAYTPKIPGQGYFIFPEIPGVHVNSGTLQSLRPTP